MRAVYYTKYGPPDVLQLKEVEKPVPKDDEVLIKIYATTVNTGDCELRGFKFVMPRIFWPLLRIMFGVFKPRRPIPGFQFAGEVEGLGKNTARFKKGDLVFGSTGLRLGSFAEYVSLPAKYAITTMPDKISFEVAAALPMALDGLHFMRKAEIKSGEEVLIVGAGGSIGTFAVQIAKSMGAVVTCVDSTNKLDMLRSIGTNHVIDYTKEDFTQNGKTYDVIFDIIGLSPFSASIKSLKRKGRYALANIRKLSLIFRGFWNSWTTDKKVIMALAGYTTKDLDVIKEMVESGKLKVVIDKSYPLEQTVEAHMYVESGQKKGNVIVTVVNKNR